MISSKSFLIIILSSIMVSMINAQTLTCYDFLVEPTSTSAKTKEYYLDIKLGAEQYQGTVKSHEKTELKWGDVVVPPGFKYEVTRHSSSSFTNGISFTTSHTPIQGENILNDNGIRHTVNYWI